MSTSSDVSLEVKQFVKQRWKTGLRQHTIAEKMGMCESYFSLIIHGKRKPPKWFNKKLKRVMEELQ